MNNKKQLIKTYIAKSISLGVPREDIRTELIKMGLERSEAEQALSSTSRKLDPTNYILILLIVGIIGTTLYLEPTLTGFVTVSKTLNFKDTIHLDFSHDDVYYWTPNHQGSLTSLRIDGEVSRSSDIKVLLTRGNLSYIVFDGVKEEDAQQEEEQLPEKENEGNTSLVSFNIAYGDNENFDPDNNGIETDQGIIDVALKEIQFNKEVSSESLCTRWKTFSQETGESTTVCFGGEICCKFVNLAPVKDSYDADFYLNYGKYGATEHNKISAQIWYVNYSLDPDKPSSDILFSPWKTIGASFIRNTISFSKECKETCILPELNDSFYRLEIITTNGTLSIQNISYSIVEVGANHAPKFSVIPDITIEPHSSSSLDLSQYITDEDNDTLYYSYSQTGEDFSVNLSDQNADIYADENFTGPGFILFQVNDSESTAFSDYVKVIKKGEEPKKAGIIEENKFQGLAVIGEPVSWTKKITLNSTTDQIRLNFTENAVNITVYKVQNESKEEISDEAIRVIENGEEKNLSDYEASNEADIIDGRISFLSQKKRNLAKNPDDVKAINQELLQLENERNGITGQVVSVQEKPTWLNDLLTWLKSSITGFIVADNQQRGTELVIDQPAEQLEIVYQTPPPQATETILGLNKKQIMISSDTHYENILAYTTINELPKEDIRLYWETAEGRKEVTDINYIDSNNNSLIDEIQWIVPHLSNETYTLELTILNVQSFPDFGGNWTVNFTTRGTANLTIRPIEGTTYGNESPDDLQFLQLRCGDMIVAANYTPQAITVNNWNCDDQIASHTIKELTGGTHVQEFTFGDQVATAHNLVDSCEYPADNMLINETTRLCSGAYNLTDAASDGLIKIQSGSARLYCNGTILTGNSPGIAITLTGSAGLDNLSINDCTFMNWTAGIQLTLTAVNNFSMINNTFINSSLKIGTAATNGLIEDNRFYNLSSLSGQNGACIYSSGDSTNVTIANNIISGCAGSAIKTDGPINNWTIMRNNVSKTSQVDITIQKSFNSVIRENNITWGVTPDNMGAGAIDLHFSNNTVISNNVINHLNGTNPIGIVITDRSINNTIRNNRIINTSSYGIQLDNTYNNTVEYNNVSEFFYAGILQTDGAGNNIIRWNIVDKTGQGGIQIEDRANNSLVEYNTVYNSSWDCLRFSGGAVYNLTFVNNTLVNCDGTGIGGYNGPENITIINNTIEYSDSVAMGIDHTNILNIISNTISNASASGISLSFVNNSIINFNRIANATTDGVLAQDVINVTVLNNTIFKTKGSAINIGPRVFNSSLINNTVTNNTLNGIHVTYSRDIIVSNNIVRNNTNYGVHLNNNVNLTKVFNNLVADNLQVGIIVSGDTNTLGPRDNLLYNNTIIKNLDGISLYAAINTTVSNNTILNSTRRGIILAAGAGNNTIFNNVFNTSTSEVAVDGTVNGQNNWNRSKTTARNILGGSAVGGNFYFNYFGTDVDGDGLGESIYTINSSGSKIDYHPIITSNCLNPSDGLTVSGVVNLCSGTFNVLDPGNDGILFISADYTTINCLGTVIIGNQTGMVMKWVSGRDNVTLNGCTLMNYSVALEFVTIRNLTITHNNLSSMIGPQALIVENGSNSVRVQDNSFGGNNQTSISILTSTQNVTIINNTFYNNSGAGINIGNNDNVLIENNSFMRTGTTITVANSQNVSLVTNYMSNTTVSRTIDMSTSNNSFISGNVLQNNSLQTIYLENVRNISIISNEIIRGVQRGIIIQPPSFNITINNNTVDLTPMANIFVQDSDGVRMLGNRVSNSSSGISITNSNNSYIEYNRIENETSNGIQIISGVNFTVNNNSIFYLRYMNANTNTISLSGVQNATISNNSMEYVANAIFFTGEESHDLLIENNYITNSTNEWNGGVITLYNNTNRTTIKHNRITNSTYGIVDNATQSSSNIEIVNNSISRMTISGIFMQKGYNNTIANNSIYLTRSHGIIVNSSNETRIVNNNIHNITAAGIYITESNYFRINYNQINNTPDSAVVISNSNNITLENNTINDISTSGVIFQNSLNLTAINTSITRAKQYGFNLSSVNGSRVDRSVIDNTTLDGIYIGRSLYSILDRNSINRSGSTGIRVTSDSPNTSVSNNVINSTFSYAIFIQSINITVANNTIDRSGDSAIYLSPANKSFVSRNTIISPTNNGILLNPAGFITIEYNWINGSSSGGINTSAGSNNISITNNNISGAAGNGIIVSGGSSNYSITNNSVSYTQASAITLASVYNSFIESNLIVNTTGALSDGIILSSGSNFSSISFNNIRNISGTAAIELSNTLNSTVVNNTISKTVADGIYIIGNNNHTIVNNTIEYTSSVGINVIGANSISIMSNFIRNTSSDAILLNTGTNFSRVFYNDILNGSIGTGIIESHTVLNITFENNTVKKSTPGQGGGFYIDGENITIYNNTVTNSTSNGIVFVGNQFTVAYNLVQNITLSGMAALPTNNSKIYKNTIEHIKEHGFVGNGNGVQMRDNSFFNNTIRYTGLSGLMFVNMVNNTLITNNTITNTSFTAINTSNPSGNNSIYNNFINTSFKSRVVDNSTAKNHWNRSKTSSINIIGGPNVGGNFYSDYIGTYADIVGIGQSPYVINGSSGSSDYLPLTNTAAVCGDGRVDPGEECDDGNTASGDGCSSVCKIEGGGGGGGCNNLNCDDRDGCTDDSCNDGTCYHAPVTCDDSCIGNTRYYGGSCQGGTCQYNQVSCGQTSTTCLDGSIATCTNGCSGTTCGSCTPTCPPPLPSPPPITEDYVGNNEGNTYPCVNVTAHLGDRITIENVTFENDLQLPSGYSLAIPPFKINCKGEDVDITLNVPSKYENLQLWACKDGVCGPLSLELVDRLKCGQDWSLNLSKGDDTNPYDFIVKIPHTHYEDTGKLSVVKAGLNTLSFIGKKPLFLTLDNPDSPLYLPKNPKLKIVGSPLAITTSGDAYFFNVTMPYSESQKIDENSIAMHAFKDGKWMALDSATDKDKNQVSAIVDTSQYQNAENKTVLALLGNLCENCIKSTLVKVYEPKKKSRNAVIFIHGLGVTQERFNDILNDIALTDQPWQAWLLGYDSSRPIEDVSKEFADLLEQNSEEYDHIYIVAHSLGGRIAQEALDHSYNENKDVQHYSYLKKVKRIILIGTPNKGLISPEVYKIFYNYATNSKVFASTLHINNEVVKELISGKEINQVPGIDYYVIAGTRPFNFLKGIIDLSAFGKNDGIVTVESAQFVGGKYINDLCNNYWEIDETHTDLLDNRASRIIIEKIIAKEIEKGFNETVVGFNQYAEFRAKSCDPDMKFLVLGIEKEGPYDPFCNCGNGKCDAGEDEVNCPSDCAVILSPTPFILSLLPLLILLLIIILLSYSGITYYKESRKKKKGISLTNEDAIHKIDERISQIDQRIKKIDEEIKRP